MIAWSWLPTPAPDHIQQARMIQLCEIIKESHELFELWYDPADHSHYSRHGDRWAWNDTSKAAE